MGVTTVEIVVAVDRTVASEIDEFAMVEETVGATENGALFRRLFDATIAYEIAVIVVTVAVVEKTSLVTIATANVDATETMIPARRCERYLFVTSRVHRRSK